MENYLKMIYRLHIKSCSETKYQSYEVSEQQPQGAVHTSEVAMRLGVSKPSACRATDLLAEKGLLRKDRYKRIYLTTDGIDQAAVIVGRYTVIERFLNEVLQMDLEKAQTDACGMEHIISNECYECMRAYLETHTTALSKSKENAKDL